MNTLLLFCGFLLTLSGVEGESPVTTACEVLYEAAINARDNILRNAEAEEYYAEELAKMRSDTKEELGLSSIDNDEEIYEISCAVANAESMAELAASLNQTEEQVRIKLKDFGYMYWLMKTTFDEYKIQMRKVHQWLRKSHFPDEWPLATTYEKTKTLLDSSSRVVRSFINLFRSMSDNARVARILTESSSLEQYLERMELDELLDDQQKLTKSLGPARGLRKRKNMLSAFRAMDSFIDLMAAILYMGIPELP